jgi:hypothetical protein
LVPPAAAAPSRDGARRLVDDLLLPRSGYGDRTSAGRDAQGLGAASDGDGLPLVVVPAHDPRLSFTYGEFPLESLDALLDAAEPHVRGAAAVRDAGTTKRRRRRVVVDLGSGCGRLALYLALSRQHSGGQDAVGIECAPLLHREALRAAGRALRAGYLLPWPSPSSSDGEEPEATSSQPPPSLLCEDTASCPPAATLTLVRGLARDRAGWLRGADLVFAYSSTWDAPRFSPETGSLLLSEEWQQLLGESCPPGCVVVTTDRSLDASASAGRWRMLARMDVRNPEVGGASTGYIQQRLP